MIYYKLLRSFLLSSAILLLVGCTGNPEKGTPVISEEGTSTTMDSTVTPEKILRDKTKLQKPLSSIPKPKIDAIEAAPLVKYFNPRFSFGFEYPPYMLICEEECDNEDGVVLVSADSTISIIASAMHNVLDETVDDLLNLHISVADFEIPEKVKVEKEPNAFTIAGKTKDGFSYVERVVLNQEVIGSCIIKYDPLNITETAIPIAKILNSFYFRETLEEVEVAKDLL